MPEVFPQGQEFSFDPVLDTFVKEPGLQIQGSTIGELLRELEKATGAYVVPHEPPKFFRYQLSRDDSDFYVVDIHVHRGGESICIKQDVAFALLPDDVVMFGLPAC